MTAREVPRKEISNLSPNNCCFSLTLPDVSRTRLDLSHFGVLFRALPAPSTPTPSGSLAVQGCTQTICYHLSLYPPDGGSHGPLAQNLQGTSSQSWWLCRIDAAKLRIFEPPLTILLVLEGGKKRNCWFGNNSEKNLRKILSKENRSRNKVSLLSPPPSSL